MEKGGRTNSLKLTSGVVWGAVGFDLGLAGAVLSDHIRENKEGILEGPVSYSTRTSSMVAREPNQVAAGWPLFLAQPNLVPPRELGAATS